MESGQSSDSEQRSGSDQSSKYDLLDNCLIAYRCADRFENVVAYKTGPNNSIYFGIITKVRSAELELADCPEYVYLLQVLTKAKMSHHLSGDFQAFARKSLGLSDMRKVTPVERELVKKAILYNGARFIGRETDGDSLQFLESTKRY